MSFPVIVFLSNDTALADDFATAAAGSFAPQPCRSLNAALACFAAENVTGAIVDFRTTPGGGHAEAGFLEAAAQRFPDVHIVVLTGPHCPEPLDRSCAVLNLACISDPTAQDLLHAFRPDVAAAPAPPAPPAREDESVVAGLTRRFETRTPQTKLMLADLEIAAKYDVTALLIGETGSGKTFLSRLIHEISPRRNEPFLPVACGALPSELIESELFGHVRGAFTSAHADKDGKFIAAGRGTILLDEIDVLGPDQQVKLLRVIESGEFEPVGSNRTLRSQARLIVASNLELQPLVQQGRFRPDLYYRLNMLKFVIPPLRDRKPDIIPLAERFVHEHAAKHGVHIERIDDSLLTALYQYPWPGNVRELENVIQRAVIYCRDGILTAQQLPSYILLGVVGPTNDASVSLDGLERPASSTLGKQIAFTERDIIEQALSKNNHSRTGTAKSLGISRVTLYNKMKKYGMTK